MEFKELLEEYISNLEKDYDISNSGGLFIVFFTAHNSAELITAPW